MYFVEKATFESPTRHHPDINISTLKSIPTHLLFTHTPRKGKSKNGLIQLPALKRGLPSESSDPSISSSPHSPYKPRKLLTEEGRRISWVTREREREALRICSRTRRNIKCVGGSNG